jgi:hypothetical protein
VLRERRTVDSGGTSLGTGPDPHPTPSTARGDSPARPWPDSTGASGTPGGAPLIAITAATVAALTVLTEALDDADADIGHSVQLMALYAAAAVPSYGGLTIDVAQSNPPLHIFAVADGVGSGDTRSSVQFNMPGRGEPESLPIVSIIFFADSAGAFVDLAADLAWLTARPPTDFVLDQHLTTAAQSTSEGQLREGSAINQAMGALIGRGYTPQQADTELSTQAANSSMDRHTAARRILAEITAGIEGRFDIG